MRRTDAGAEEDEVCGLRLDIGVTGGSARGVGAAAAAGRGAVTPNIAPHCVHAGVSSQRPGV